MISMQTPSLFGQDPAPVDDAICAACGHRLRYRGRRRSTTIWECENPECPVTIAERLDPAQAERPGGAR